VKRGPMIRPVSVPLNTANSTCSSRDIESPVVVHTYYTALTNGIHERRAVQSTKESQFSCTAQNRELALSVKWYPDQDSNLRPSA
jgi:hypothetical protein